MEEAIEETADAGRRLDADGPVDLPGVASSGLRCDVPISDEMLDTMREEGANILMGSDEILLHGERMTVDEYFARFAQGDNARFVPELEDTGVMLLQSDATRLEALEEFFHRDQLIWAREMGASFPGDAVHELRYELDVQRRIKTYFVTTHEGTPTERTIVWDKIKELNEIIDNYKGGFRRK